MEVEKIHTDGKLKADGLHIISVESGKQIGQMYLMNFNHDKGGRQIKDMEGIGNANHMVKCWNMYDELVEFVKSVNEYGNVLQSAQMEKARELLKKIVEI